MNDTLDDLKYSQLDDYFQIPTQKGTKDLSISFDDSLFLKAFNSQEENIVENIKSENASETLDVDLKNTNVNTECITEIKCENNSFDDSLFSDDFSLQISISSKGSKVNTSVEKNDQLNLSENDLFLDYDVSKAKATDCINVESSLNTDTTTLENTSLCDNKPNLNIENNFLTIREDIFLNPSICNENLKDKSTLTCRNVTCEQEKTAIVSLSSQNNQKILNQNLLSRNRNLNDISRWGLPNAVIENYANKNIREMFDWQVECLNNVKLMIDKRNLVYSAPTSAGKTLVSEILAMKCLFERKKKVIFILPFISVVREKMMYFRDILNSSNIRVEGYMGSYNPPGGFQTIQMAIGTIEKCNSLINRLLEENKLSDLGLIIIDEIHLIGDSSRGYLLELLLTKLKYIMLKNNSINIQIVGMSATLPNLDTLANWLDAELYTTDFRPIPLHEMVYVNRELYYKDFKLARKLDTLPELTSDTDDILQLCLETVETSCSVLIFCSTKNWCENLAQQIAQAFWKLGISDSSHAVVLRNNLSTEKIQEILEQLKYCPAGLDKILKNTIAFGVAFHHAGLTMEEREIIEGGFKNGSIRVLVATSTLSSGVNLPARRVIIRSPLFGGKTMDILTYRQMIGRAGRMGIDTEGQSILICQKSDYKVAKYLTNSTLQPVTSCLNDIGKFKRAILEIIASGVAATPDDVQLFQNCTLATMQNSLQSLEADPIKHVVEFLEKFNFIRLQKIDDNNIYVPTALGKACLSSSLPPGEGLELFTELEKARQCFVLETELHLIYLVTPYSACYQWPQIDWMFYLDLWEKLSPSMKRVGELVGVKDSFIIKSTRGNPPNDQTKLFIHKRFFIALALQDLVNEKPLDEVCLKFNCNRGLLQSLQQSASTFAGMVTSFSRQLGWSTVEILISQFQDRLQFGVNRDLLDLMRIPCLDAKRARTFYNSGIETLIQLANSDVYTIENILHKVAPFESSNEREGETAHELKQRNKLRTIWITGKLGLSEREAADIILNSAREYLEHEMGVSGIKWGDNDLNISVGNEINNTESILISKDSNEAYESDKIVELNSSQEDLFEDCLQTTTDLSLTADNRKRINNAGLPGSSKKIKFNLKEENCTNFEMFSIIEVDKNIKTYNQFLEEVKSKKEISLSLACSALDNKIIICIDKKLPKIDNKYSHDGRKVQGVSITWDEINVYFIPFNDNEITQMYIRDLNEILSNQNLSVKMFDSKENIVYMKNALDIQVNSKIEDVKIMDYIISKSFNEKTFKKLIKEHVPTAKKYLTLLDSFKGTGSLGLNTEFDMEYKMKSSLEAVLTSIIAKAQKFRIQHSGKSYLDLFDSEMAASIMVAQMEIVGFAVDQEHIKALTDLVEFSMSSIEKYIYEFAGKKFNINSRIELARVLKLFPENDPKARRKARTTKKALKRLENPIANNVLILRKLRHVLSANILPLISTIKNDRIHGTFNIFTATGRFAMEKPSAQLLHKDFKFENPITKEQVVISCRNIFVASKNHILVSIDYCQLELRILTHLTQDKNLLRIMKEDGDIFKKIAAKWNKISEDQVTDGMRDQSKKICYGIIYGMGTRTLADQMGIEVEEAAILIQEFNNTYPGIKKYSDELVEKCKKKGYIKTILGRERKMPSINDSNPAVQGHTIRRAINSTIQGSASDLVKRGMYLINERANSLFLNGSLKLVMHLHDELIFEVQEKISESAIKLLKSCMESPLDLSVPFPVKVKIGNSWGNLREYSEN